MFDDFAAQILKAEVAGAGNFLRDCAGTAVVTGIRREDDRSGPKAIIDLLVVDVDPTSNPEANTPGQTVQKQYRFNDGTADKRAAVMASFKRDMCVLANEKPNELTGEKLAAISKAAKEGAFTGVAIRFEPYEKWTKATPTKPSESRTYHTLKLLSGINSAAQIKARAQALSKGAGVAEIKKTLS